MAHVLLSKCVKHDCVDLLRWPFSLSQTSGTARPVVRKKAALCLLRLMRKTPADAQLVSAETFAPIMGRLLEEHDLGLLLSSVTLLLGLCSRAGSGECCQSCWTCNSCHYFSCRVGLQHADGMQTACFAVHALPCW